MRRRIKVGLEAGRTRWLRISRGRTALRVQGSVSRQLASEGARSRFGIIHKANAGQSGESSSPGFAALLAVPMRCALSEQYRR